MLIIITATILRNMIININDNGSNNNNNNRDHNNDINYIR